MEKAINKILILGAGTLGSRIALQSAISGYSVCIYDINEASFERAKVTHNKLLPRIAKMQDFSIDLIPEILNRISYTTDKNEAAANTDLVSESVTENLEIKQQVWKEFSTLLPEDCILTTNTSYMLSSWLAEYTGNPGRFCAFHFHDVFNATVVDIMPHPGTEKWVVDLLFKLGKKLKQTPVIINKESQGYIFNRMLGAIIASAGQIVADDVCSFEDVDRSWMGNFKMPIGPFGLLDEIGLDTALHVVGNTKLPGADGLSELLRNYIDDGKLGVKTGEGFYQYPRPGYKDPDFV